MIDLLAYLLKQGKATQTDLFPRLPDFALGMPQLDPGAPCTGSECGACTSVCPTSAIEISSNEKQASVTLDLGACIGCGLCISVCPTKTIVRNLRTDIATRSRQELILNAIGRSAAQNAVTGREQQAPQPKDKMFRRALSIRVVSTGCSACDLELGAAGNPIFDMERFGIQVVASPRMADALVVTGPVGSAMKEALLRTYQAMPEPRLVIALGTCAISGGVHRNGYASANGLGAHLPVDVFIPGCPPHPWSIIHSLMLAMRRSRTASNASLHS